MNKRTNRELLPVRIIIAVAIVAIFAASLFLYFGQETVAMQSAREAYAQFLSENPQSQDKDFIFVYEDTIIIAIRNGKVIRKEYATEADAVSAALNSASGANYSLSGTGDGKLFVVKLFEKTDDIYALGTATLPTGADKLTIKVVSNGMIFATFEIPAEAIDRKESPVGVTIKTLAADSNVTLGENETGFAYDIDVTNLVENNTARINISMNGPRGLVAEANKSAITMYHKDKIISSTYDAETGMISFSTTSFSPYTCTWNEVKVGSLEELRYYLQMSDVLNITLTENITIDMDNGGREVGTEGVHKYTNVKYGEMYAAKGYYASEGADKADWLYFGALVHGAKALNLNGKTITYIGGQNANDNALFCVDGNSRFVIYDNSENKGAVEIKFDQYAVWAVENTSRVDIYDGIFVADAYAGTTSMKDSATNRAILYSSGGTINVRGGYFLYENSNDNKRNGGFNVRDELNVLGEPRIWIHKGAYLCTSIYRQDGTNDNKSIVLVGGTELTELAEQVTIHGFAQWQIVKDSSITVSLAHTDKMLYRVGNLNEIPLAKLFNGDLSGVSVRIVDIVGTDLHNANLAKNFVSGSDYYKNLGDVTIDDIYSNGNINFAETTAAGFTGPIRVELYNSSSHAIYAQLFLEVVDGTNVTDSSKVYTTNDSENLYKNLCLLEDIYTGSSITVQNGYAIYGNSFTIHDKRDNPSQDSGIINVKSGTLDNVQIMGYTSSGGYLNNSDAGRAPIVNITGNANVYNSYIYGGHSAVLIISGTIRFENVLLDGGGFCNLWLNGKADVTFKDCTTTKDTRNGPVGMGVVVSNPDAKVKLEGTLKQYNWVTKEDTGSYATYLDYLFKDGSFAYSGYLNVGLFFVDPSGGGGKPFPESVVTQIMEVEEFDYKDQYVIQEKTVNTGITTVTAGAYIPKATEISKTWFGTPVYTPNSYEIYEPSYSFTLSDEDDIPNNNDNTDYCEYDGKGIVTIGTTKAEVSLDLSNIVVNWYNRPVSYKLYIDGNEVSGDVTLPFKTSYTVTIKTTVCSRTSNGEPINSKEEYSDTLTINMVKLAIPNPEFVTFPTSGSGHIWLVGGNALTDKDFAEAIPVFNGIKVKFWDDANTYYEVPLTDVLGTGSVDTTTGYATITFDGHEKLYDCVLTIYSAECKPSSSQDKFYYSAFVNVNNKMYLYNGAGQHNYDTEDSNGKTPYKQTFSYTFTDRNGNTVSQSITYSFDRSNPGQYADYNDFIKGTYTKDSPTPRETSCVTPDTLVTLADGTKKEIQHIITEDMLMVWNHYTGKYDVVPAAIVFDHGYDNNTIIKLNFSDGTQVKMINLHQFLDVDLNKYVSIDAETVSQYVGHRFAKRDGNGYTTVTLESFEISEEYIKAYGIISALHYNFLVEDMFSTDFMYEDYDLFNYFEIGDGLVYDATKMEEDIAKYGLYTYADFADYLTYEQFVGFNVQYFKIAVGKGLYTYEGILNLIDTYLKG